MKKKIIAIGIISMFLMVGLSAFSAAGIKTSISEKTSDLNENLEIEITKFVDPEDHLVYGIAAYAINNGDEPIDNVELKSSAFKIELGKLVDKGDEYSIKKTITLDPGADNKWRIALYIAESMEKNWDVLKGVNWYQFKFEVKIQGSQDSVIKEQSVKSSYYPVKEGFYHNYRGEMEFVSGKPKSTSFTVFRLLDVFPILKLLIKL